MPSKSTGTGRHTTLSTLWHVTLGRLNGTLHFRTVDALRTALVESDTKRIGTLLQQSVALIVDSRWQADGDPRVVRGHRAVVGALLHGTHSEEAISLDVRSVNGQAGLVLSSPGATIAVMCVDVTAGLVSSVWVRLQPEKLRHGHHI